MGQIDGTSRTQGSPPLPATALGVVALTVAGLLLAPALLWAQAPEQIADPEQAVEPPARFAGSQLNLALTNGLPAVLGTGMSTGVALRWLQPGRWTWGGELSGASATEYGASWQVAHLDIRARGLVGVQAALGRARVAALLGLGVTAVQENRLRQQGERLGLTGDALEQTTWGALASADLLAVVAVPVTGAWAAIVAGGPALHVGQDGPRAGWTAQLGVGWLP